MMPQLKVDVETSKNDRALSVDYSAFVNLTRHPSICVLDRWRPLQSVRVDSVKLLWPK